MRNGLKKQIHTAIFTLLGSVALAHAGWNTNAWPPTNYLRFPIPTNGGVAASMCVYTGLYALAHTWEIELEADYAIPGWTSNGYIYPYVDYDTNQSDYAAIGIPAGTASNLYAVTNYYMTDIGVPRYGTPPAETTNTVTTYSYFAWPSGLPIGYAPNASVTNIVTLTWTDTSEWVATNVWLNAPEVRQYDAWMSTAERYRDYSTPYSKLRLYRWEADTLAALKGGLMDIVEDLPILGTYWVRPEAWTNEPTAKHYLTANTDVYPPRYTNGLWQVLSDASAPTNYNAYTPHRWIEGTGPTNASILTNDYTYGAFDVMDYGWRHWKPIVSNLVVKTGNLFVSVTGTNPTTISVSALPTSVVKRVEFYSRDETNVVWTWRGNVDAGNYSTAAVEYASEPDLYHGVYHVYDWDYP